MTLTVLHYFAQSLLPKRILSTRKVKHTQTEWGGNDVQELPSFLRTILSIVLQITTETNAVVSLEACSHPLRLNTANCKLGDLFRIAQKS